MPQPTIHAALLALLALSACDAAPPVAEPSPRSGATKAASAPQGPEKLVVAVGDSLYAGYGLKPGESWPAKLEAALRDRGINARVVNAGVSGDTTAAGRQRLAFVLDAQARKPDLVALGFGGNDMLRGLSPDEARANLDAMLSELDKRGIPVLITGMLAAPNLGKDYADSFNAIFPTLAKKHDAALVPFFLQPVIERSDLMQGDHVHPTAAGIDAIVGETVDDVERALVAPPG